MAEPFKPLYVARMVGFCDSCGNSARSWGIQSGRATTVCDKCATGIADAVKALRIPKSGKLRVEAA